MGKTFGSKFESSLTPTGNIKFPGPGTYLGEKQKKQDYKFSIGARLPTLRINTNVPGPGQYDFSGSKSKLETCKSSRFGNEVRRSLENPNAKKIPGPV